MAANRILAAAALLAGTAVAASVIPASAGSGKPPKTGFEERNGASWTTHEEELEFLAAVDTASARADVDVIAETKQGRPMHLVRLGHPRPRSRADILDEPTLLFVCSQHGNEPAGRETCLKLLRDLAFTKERQLVDQLKQSTVMFIPAANPDGSEASTRGNADGVDVNRDHLNLRTSEARAIATVVRDYKPDVVLDLHEYGPSVPVLYDDDVLYLWPRNLNVDPQVYSLSKALAVDYIGKGSEAAGYTSDEYGLYAAGDQDVAQTAGDADEGILRNAMGLRHAIGILVESAVTPNPRHGSQEVTSQADVNLRRVESQMVVGMHTLRFMREQGDLAAFATAGAPKRKIREGKTRSEPVYFGGADNDPPEESEIQDPPPCGYVLTPELRDRIAVTMRLLGMRARPEGEGFFVSMAQDAEPVIPLLLDERGLRHAVEAEPIGSC